jgi:hypothetical protein
MLQSIQSKPLTPQTFSEEMEISKKIQKIQSEEEINLAQRAKINWLKFGDKNSNFFHAALVERKRQNRVVRLDVAGYNISDDKEMKSEATRFFKDLFSTSGPRNYEAFLSPFESKVTHEMNVDLMKPITIEEVENAVQDLGSLKSPGPDGFPGLFYSKFWPEIGTDIFQAIKNIFAGKTILKDINQTFIALIPKINFPSSLNHFRPYKSL